MQHQFVRIGGNLVLNLDNVAQMRKTEHNRNFTGLIHCVEVWLVGIDAPTRVYQDEDGQSVDAR